MQYYSDVDNRRISNTVKLNIKGSVLLIFPIEDYFDEINREIMIKAGTTEIGLFEDFANTDQSSLTSWR